LDNHSAVKHSVVALVPQVVDDELIRLEAILIEYGEVRAETGNMVYGDRSTILQVAKFV
jgi:hypothetical protein